MRYGLLALCLMLMATVCGADIYRWVDEKGNVHFGDANSRPASGDVESVEVEVNTYTEVTYQRAERSAESSADRVVMYSTAWCGYCKKARRYFVSNRIPFVEYDIEKDASAKRRYDRMGANGVPVILYRDKRMNGFSKKGFERFYRPDA